MTMPVFDHAQPLTIELAFLNLHQYAKNQLNSSSHSSDTAFRVSWPNRLCLFLTTLTQ